VLDEQVGYSSAVEQFARDGAAGFAAGRRGRDRRGRFAFLSLRDTPSPLQLGVNSANRPGRHRAVRTSHAIPTNGMLNRPSLNLAVAQPLQKPRTQDEVTAGPLRNPELAASGRSLQAGRWQAEALRCLRQAVDRVFVDYMRVLICHGPLRAQCAGRNEMARIGHLATDAGMVS
jgi:hypothetical protein